MKKLCLLLTVVSVLWLLACAAPQDEPVNQGQVVHYVNNELVFSIDYPGNWQLEEVDPNEIVIRPRDSEYNQIRIGARSDYPMLYYVSEPSVAATVETALQQFFDELGASDLNIVFNERVHEEWDWIAQFTVTYGGRPLDGVQFMKQIEPMTYWLFIMKYMDWPEGFEVISSFKLLD